MTINLNHGILQGYVVSVYEGEGNVKVTLVGRDDFTNNDGDKMERPYFWPITFFGKQAENIVKFIEKGSFLTVEVKITSYIPKDSEFHQLSLVGTSFFLTPRISNDSEPAQKSNTNNKNRNNDKSKSKPARPAARPDRTSRNARPSRNPAPVEAWDDDDELPPWGDDDDE